MHPVQITLSRDAVIWWSCPYTCSEGSGLRPDYWAGNTALPRVIQHRNVVGLTFRLAQHGWMSHCFFDPARFDEVRFVGRWVFARAGDGYVGIWSQHSCYVGRYGQYAGRELICEAPENTWLAECGRAVDWTNFDAFVVGLSSAAIGATDDSVAYDSPSIGRFVTGWDVQPAVNGQPIQLHGYPLVDSAWAHSEFGSGKLLIQYGGERYEVWIE